MVLCVYVGHIGASLNSVCLTTTFKVPRGMFKIFPKLIVDNSNPYPELLC